MGKLATKKASFKIIKTKAVVEMLSEKVARGGGTDDGEMEVKKKPFRWSPPIRYKFCICQVKCEYLCAYVGSSWWGLSVAVIKLNKIKWDKTSSCLQKKNKYKIF